MSYCRRVLRGNLLTYSLTYRPYSPTYLLAYLLAYLRTYFVGQCYGVPGGSVGIEECSRRVTPHVSSCLRLVLELVESLHR